MKNGMLKAIRPLSSEDKFLNLSRLELTGVTPKAFDSVPYITSLELNVRNYTFLSESVFLRLTKLRNLKLRVLENLISITTIESYLERYQSFDLKMSKIFEPKEILWTNLFYPNAFSGLPDNCLINSQFGDSIRPWMFGINETVQIGKRDLSRFNCSDYHEKMSYKRFLTNLIDDTHYIYENRTKICIDDGKVERVAVNITQNCTRVQFINKNLNLTRKGIKSFNRNWYKITYSFSVGLLIDENEIEEIDDKLLNRLPRSVNMVSLNKNKIKLIKSNVTANNNIYQLFLENNNIEVIERDAFRRMNNLIELHLKSNLIGNLDFVASLPNTLVHLVLSDNMISNIPNDTFAQLTRLFYLDLSDNNIQSISGKPFAGLKKLNVLLLNNNKIGKIENGPYDDLRCVQTLRFNRNKISIIERGFAKNMNNANEIFLAHSCNNATKFERGLLYGLPSDSRIYLCHFEDMTKLSSLVYSVEAGVFRNSTPFIDDKPRKSSFFDFIWQF